MVEEQEEEEIRLRGERTKKGFAGNSFIKGKTLKSSKMAQALLMALIVAFSTGIVSSKSVNEITTLEITPGHRKQLEVGKGIQFECEPSAKKVNISWLLPNGTRVKMGAERRIHQASGTLQITKATLNDSGIYTCYSEHSIRNATISLVVYVMPTFYFESMIIVGINCFLIGLFFMCFLYAIVYQKWKKRKAGAGNQQNEKERTGRRC